MTVGGGRSTVPAHVDKSDRSRRGEMTRRALPVLVVALVLMVGCGALDPFEKVEKGLRGEGPDKPRWAKKYDVKTCRSWRRDMNSRSKAKAAKEMLTSLRVRDVAPLHEAPPPGGRLIDEFRDEMARGCSMATGKITLGRAAQHAYIGDSKFRPVIP
jgi:hypothetical protein